MMAFAIMIAMSGCKAGVNGNNTVTDRNGEKVVRENRSVGQFEKLTMIGSYDVEYRQGKTCKVEVSAPRDIMDKVVTENKNGTLMIGPKKIAGVNVVSHAKRDVKVYVTAPSLSYIKMIGSGDFDAKNMTATLLGKSLEVELLGSGDIEIDNVVADLVKVNLQGSGDIEIKNIEAKYSVTAELKGAGDIELDKIATESFEPRLNGSGDISAHVDCILVKAELNGTGDLKLSGKTLTYEKSKTGIGDYDDRELKRRVMKSNETQHSSGHATGLIESRP